MLVLSRGTNESIILRINGEMIAKITVVDGSRPNRTRLGVQAGPEVVIHREEVDKLLYTVEIE